MSTQRMCCVWPVRGVLQADLTASSRPGKHNKQLAELRNSEAKLHFGGSPVRRTGDKSPARRAGHLTDLMPIFGFHEPVFTSKQDTIYGVLIRSKKE